MEIYKIETENCKMFTYLITVCNDGQTDGNVRVCKFRRWRGDVFAHELKRKNKKKKRERE